MTVENKLLRKTLAAFAAEPIEDDPIEGHEPLRESPGGTWTTRCGYPQFVNALGRIAWNGRDDDDVRPRILLIHQTGREYLATVIAGAFDPIIEITWNKGEVTARQAA